MSDSANQGFRPGTHLCRSWHALFLPVLLLGGSATFAITLQAGRAPSAQEVSLSWAAASPAAVLSPAFYAGPSTILNFHGSRIF